MQKHAYGVVLTIGWTGVCCRLLYTYMYSVLILRTIDAAFRERVAEKRTRDIIVALFSISPRSPSRSPPTLTALCHALCQVLPLYSRERCVSLSTSRLLLPYLANLLGFSLPPLVPKLMAAHRWAMVCHSSGTKSRNKTLGPKGPDHLDMAWRSKRKRVRGNREGPGQSASRSQHVGRCKRYVR